MIYQFFRRNWSLRTAILITEISISVQESRQEEKTTAKSKQRSGNYCCTKQWKQPNVNSGEATSTRNTNENAKMQANHSRNQNRKAAEVLLKGLESKLRLDYQPLFGKMSPHSSPERAAGRVRFPLLVLANHVTACRFSYGKDCPEIVAEIITSKIDPSHGEAISTARRH